MARTKYTFSISTGGHRAFTMPQGFMPTIHIYAWGAGGGTGGSGAPGGGGGHVHSIETANPGDVIEIGVGLPGAPGSGVTPGAGGGSQIGLRYSGGPGASGYWDNEYEGGYGDGPYAGGGGGGASGVLINNLAVAIAAGGGGGGGGGDDYGAIAQSYGLSAGVQSTAVASSAPYYPYYSYYYPYYYYYYYYYWWPVRWWYWGWWLNYYGIWQYSNYYSQTFNKTIYFPVTGTYTFYASSDKLMTWTLDGNAYTISQNSYTSYTIYNISVTAGNHTLNAVANYYGWYYNGYAGGTSGGFGMQIFDPSGAEIWHTQLDSTTNQLTQFTQGGEGLIYGGGGGGGGHRGGAGGNGGGDDGYSYGGSGGLNFGDYCFNGSGQNPGGLGTTYYPGSSIGRAGYGGYVTLVFERRFRIFTKNQNDWNRVLNGWVKANNTWKEVENVYIKSNNTWKPVLSTEIVPDDKSIKYITAGSYNWVCPANVTRAKIMAYGAGGSGLGGGGGAGGLAVKMQDVTPGQVYSVIVGAGGRSGADGTYSSFNGDIIGYGGSGTGNPGYYLGSPIANIVGYWPMNEGSGYYFYDKINNQTAYAPYMYSGHMGWSVVNGEYAPHFDGTSYSYSYLTSENPKMHLTQTAGSAYTYEAWVYRTGAGQAGYWGGELINHDPDFEIAVLSDGRVVIATDWGQGTDTITPGSGWIGAGATMLNLDVSSEYSLGHNVQVDNYTTFGGMSVPPAGFSGNVAAFGLGTNDPSPDVRSITSTRKISFRGQTKVQYAVNMGTVADWGEYPDYQAGNPPPDARPSGGQYTNNESIFLQFSFDGTTWTTLDTVHPTQVSPNVWTVRSVTLPNYLTSAQENEATENEAMESIGGVYSETAFPVYLRFWQYREGYTDHPRDTWAVTEVTGDYNAGTSTAIVPLNTPTHVAVVVNGKLLKIYINGVLKWVWNNLDRRSSYHPEYYTYFGNRTSAYQGFQGYINHVRIWNIARSDAQIAQYYTTRGEIPQLDGGAGGVASGGDFNYTGHAGQQGRVVYYYWYWWWGWGNYYWWNGWYYYGYGYGYYNYYWGYGWYGWGWPWWYRYYGFEYGKPGVGYDGIGGGSTGPDSTSNVGASGAILIIC